MALSGRTKGIVCVFAVAFAYLWWVAGNRLILTNDEGTFLSHAARIAQGEVLYRDLFGLTGPASYWLLAAVFTVFGTSLAAAHLILVTQLAALTAVVFFVSYEMCGRVWAAFGAVVFLIWNSTDSAMLTNNHRWDSSTYAILGVVAIWRGRPVLGGVLLALGVWATPILALTALTAVGAAVLVGQSPWRVMAGGAAGAVGGVLALALTGSLSGYIENLLWMKANYSDVNRMMYGAVIGGYPALFAGASGAVEWTIRLGIVAAMTAPAWLPVLCGAALLRNGDRTKWYLFACGVSMIAAMTPRFDLGHLVFSAPLFYPIAVSFWRRAQWTVVPVGAVSLLFVFSTAVQRFDTVEVSSPMGQVRTDPESAKTVHWLLANTKPGEGIFVYPYQPIFYILTGGKNVSRYTFMQPGVFTVDDERAAIEDMRKRPPAKVVHTEVALSDYLRLWPSSDPAKLQLRELDEFVKSNFDVSATYQNIRILTPRQRASADRPVVPR